MLISTKGRYAVRILTDIAQNDGGAVRAADISVRQGITPKYTEQIMRLLVSVGLLRSVRGANGGYLLTKSPRNYKISEILQKTEGDLSPVDCVKDANSCARTEACSAHSLWCGLYRVIYEYLDGITLADLVESVAPPSDQYFI